MQPLTDHTGSWSGTNRFRLRPTDEPQEAPATAAVSLAAGGNLAVLRYTWSHQDDGPQEGLLTIGREDEEGRFLAVWSDSWHQAPAATTLRGAGSETTITLECIYSGDWVWIIVIDAAEPGTLRLRMDNVVPESAAAQGFTPGAYWAMDAVLRPASGSY